MTRATFILFVCVPFTFLLWILLLLHDESTQAAIVRFHGVEFMGRKLRVEEIRDDPRKGRVKVPEKIVSYVLGAAKSISRKKKKNGTRLEGGLRRIAPRLSKDNNSNNGSSSNNNTKEQQRT